MKMVKSLHLLECSRHPNYFVVSLYVGVEKKHDLLTVVNVCFMVPPRDMHS